LAGIADPAGTVKTLPPGVKSKTPEVYNHFDVIIIRRAITPDEPRNLFFAILQNNNVGPGVTYALDGCLLGIFQRAGYPLISGSRPVVDIIFTYFPLSFSFFVPGLRLPAGLVLF
jgi:hypothetical protein